MVPDDGGRSERPFVRLDRESACAPRARASVGVTA